jgi:amino acid permease
MLIVFRRRQAGPLGAWLGYTIVGVLVVAPVISIAEMSALLPLSGGVVRHAGKSTSLEVSSK